MKEIIRIYSNPFQNSVNIINGSDKKLAIYDIYGKICHIKTLRGNEEHIDMSDYASGVYFFKIDNYVFKLVKN